MKRLLGRIGLPMLAAAILAVANLPAAQADPGGGDGRRCGSPEQILPEVTVTTCTHYSWWMYGEHWGYRGWIIINNNSGYTINVRPDLLVNGTAYVGNTYTVDPHVATEFAGNMVEKPQGTKQGRGYFQVGGWSTYTYAPAY